METRSSPQVISASRRTDIPAFYTEWFMQRIRAGFARCRNPFGGQFYEVSLTPEDVMAFVFWSRNYRPLLPHLPELDQRGYRGYFHLTITGMGAPLEPHAPPISEAIVTAQVLAERYSPRHVLWRFDPIILANTISRDVLLARFDTLARQLSGITERCYISFVDFYAKTSKNLSSLLESGIQCYDPEPEEQIDLLRQMIEIGATWKIGLYACCEADVLGIAGMHQAHCVDADLLAALWPDVFRTLKAAPTRTGCGCFASRDLGAYDTCIYGCRYCYANASHQKALTNYQRHNPHQPSL